VLVGCPGSCWIVKQQCAHAPITSLPGSGSHATAQLAGLEEPLAENVRYGPLADSCAEMERPPKGGLSEFRSDWIRLSRSSVMLSPLRRALGRRLLQRRTP